MEIKESKIKQTLTELRKLADAIRKHIKRAIPQAQLLQKNIKDLDPRLVLETASDLHKKLNEHAKKLNEYAIKLERFVKGLPKTVSQSMRADLCEIKTLHDELWEEVDKTHREIAKLMSLANA